jgi:topoisomerase-4 subunit B
MTTPARDYSASDIKILEGLEAVRKRPGMYIGTTGIRGLHHLVYEIVDNCVDECLAGHATSIDVRMEPGNVIQVVDDGRGVPVDIHPQLGISAATVVFTKLHAGAKFDSNTYKVSGGLHGVGASVVNALSEYLELEIYRGGKIHKQRFERGDPVAPLAEAGPTRKRGTLVRFRPDATIFPITTFTFETLSTRLRELAFLNGGIKISITDRREGTHEAPHAEYKFDGGVRAFVEYLNESRQSVGPPVWFKDTYEGIEVECCFQYHTDYSESVSSFVNCISTVEGGTHETGFKTAHTRLMNEYVRRLGLWKKKDNLSGEDLREGMTCVLSLRMANTEFEGQTKTKLGNPEARAAVEQVVGKHLERFLEENPDHAREILDKACKAASARAAAREAREAVRQGKTSAGRTSLNGKLTRCASRDPMERELFLVEGDSAGGSAKQARDRHTQAILPLRGKPLNTERAALAKVLANKEVMSVTQAVGAGIGSEFNISDAQYGRIVILSDADDDGAHIRCLLLTFFYRFMKDLITHGRVFIAQPPLYKLTVGKKKQENKYAWTNEELQELLSKKGTGNADIQRFKGLGEMNADQLWETTMNPATRTLVKVEIADAAAAERSVSLLMGDGAEARRDWITMNVPFGPENEPVPVGPRKSKAITESAS